VIANRGGLALDISPNTAIRGKLVTAHMN
jgi:hypothetical protein